MKNASPSWGGIFRIWLPIRYFAMFSRMSVSAWMFFIL